MKTISQFFIFFSLWLCICKPAQATSYLYLSANTGETYDGISSGCAPDADGYVTGSSSCTLYYSILLPSGITINSVTMYYYDNSGSQSFSASLTKLALSSTSGAATTLASTSDTSTSASIQSATLSYGSAVSSSYVYQINVSLNYDTRLSGIKISYN